MRALTERIEPRFTSAPPVEQRDLYSDGWGASRLGGPVSGGAEGVAAVVACVELIAGAISSLPALIVQDDGQGGRVAVPGAAAGRILARPNDLQSWPSFVSTLVGSYLVHGNGIAQIGSDGRGSLLSLTAIPWPWIMPYVIGSSLAGAGRARLVFDVVNQTPESQLLGLPPRLLAGDVLHLKARSDAGVIGRSVLARAPAVIRSALSVQTLAASLYEQGASISGVLTVSPKTTPDGIRRLRSQLDERHAGASNAGKIMLADQGSTFLPITQTASDAELLGSRAFSVADVARLFNVPAPLLMTGAAAPPSLDPFIAAFAQLCLTPIVFLLEQEISALLPPGQFLALDLAGLTRGAWTGVAAAYSVLVQSKIATPNDARSALGLAPHEDGDQLGRGAPPAFPADASGMPSLAPKPGDAGPIPNVGTNQGEGSAN